MVDAARSRDAEGNVDMRWVLSGMLVTSLAALGCGGSQSSDVASTSGGGLEEAPPPAATGPVNARGSTEATGTVGRAGGTFALANGGRLEIPSGAIASATDVRFANGADGQAFGDRENQRPLGPMLNVEPAIRSEGGDLRVSIPQQPIPNGWSEDDLAFAMEEVADQQRAMDVLGTVTRWQFYRARVENGRFVAEVPGVPGHRVQFGVAR